MKREIRPLTLSEAISRDISEIENIEKGGPIAFADYMVINDGTIKELKTKLKGLI
jgi:dephospho-CoA kinase